ncbi:tail fiber domain-containing protein [Fusobacterium ulcerans]|uniref:tail fiber domain-containing protein n=1 Tax=Fusobacterium ulcerans TaxID=861 RepID=UPI00241F1C82|nr:tail fiber domain-containing protein [Fusobacterium ulcerans]
MKNLGEYTDIKDIPRKEDIKVFVDTINKKCAVGDMEEEKFASIGSRNIFVGLDTGNGTGTDNVAIGKNILENNQRGSRNIGIGIGILSSNANGSSNVVIGNEVLRNNNSGSFNIAIGENAGYRLRHSDRNVIVGNSALYNTEGSDIVAIGFKALYSSATTYFNNIIGIGSEVSVTGANQAQIGNSNVTVYCYGAVQNRSDKRDKTDIQDTSLGLNFLLKLRPREYRWDYREDYINHEAKERELEDIENLEISEKEKEKKREEILKKYSLENVIKDGKQKGWRLHQGFIAQEVFETMRELGVDFGGYQDHSINGGKDVLSLGYEEFIPILVKGLQEQQEEIKELKSRIEKLEGIK